MPEEVPTSTSTSGTHALRAVEAAAGVSAGRAAPHYARAAHPSPGESEKHPRPVWVSTDQTPVLSGAPAGWSGRRWKDCGSGTGAKAAEH